MLVKIKLQENDLMNSVELFELFSKLGAVYSADNEITDEVKNGGKLEVRHNNNNSDNDVRKFNNNGVSYEYGNNDTTSLFDFDNDIVCSDNDGNDALVENVQTVEMSPETNKSIDDFNTSSRNNMKSNGSFAGRIDDKKICKKEANKLQSINEEEKKKLKQEENEIRKLQHKLLLMQEKHQHHQKQQQQQERNIENRKSKMKLPVRSVRPEAINERSMKNNSALNNENVPGNRKNSLGDIKTSKSRIPGPSSRGRKDDRVLNQSNLNRSNMNICNANDDDNKRQNNQYNEDNNNNEVNNDISDNNNNNNNNDNSNNSKNRNENNTNMNDQIYDTENELLDPYYDDIENQNEMTDERKMLDKREMLDNDDFRRNYLKNNFNDLSLSSGSIQVSSNAALVSHIQVRIVNTFHIVDCLLAFLLNSS